jgi:hypothetical protein
MARIAMPNMPFHKDSPAVLLFSVVAVASPAMVSSLFARFVLSCIQKNVALTIRSLKFPVHPPCMLALIHPAERTCQRRFPVL